MAGTATGCWSVRTLAVGLLDILLLVGLYACTFFGLVARNQIEGKQKTEQKKEKVVA